MTLADIRSAGEGYNTPRSRDFSDVEFSRGPRTGPPLPPVTLAGFLIAAAAVVLIALFSYRALQSRSYAAERVTHTLEVRQHLQALLSLLKDAETGQRGYLLTGVEGYLEPYTDASTQLPAELERLQALLADNPAQRQRLGILKRLVMEKTQELGQTIALRRTGQVEQALELVRTDRGRAVMDRIRGTLEDAEHEEQSLYMERQEEWRKAANFSAIVTWGGSGLLLFLILLAAVMTSRDYRHRQAGSWIRMGQMGMSLRTQGEQRLEHLGERILEFLARYLNAYVGALYIAQADGSFRRIAGYALGADAKGEVLRSGESLLGQAAKENRTLQVREVPDRYLCVASSLGKAKPSELLVAPAAIDGSVQAVVELGFFRPLQAADLELMSRLSESLGFAVRSSKDRTRLEELLEETQRQAEELQTQQEELRVSNEELAQQGNILRDSQARLETQQVELEQTNTQLEEHSQALSRQNDDIEAARRELTVKATELERSNQFKSEFLANMSHELRTPLNSALILAKLLGDNAGGNLTEEQVRFSRNIYAAGNDLLDLINDILDLSKIEAGKVQVSRETVGVSYLVENLAQTFQPIADEKRIAFVIEVAADAPDMLQTDSQRLKQILKNLLSNAFKFTSEGQVSLHIYSPGAAGRRRGDDDGWIAFEVRDTGIGIAPQQQEIIFEPFRQADGTTNRKFGGTGLGLSISRQLATLLGGRVELRSALGAGSTFTLLLPQSLPAQERGEAAVTLAPFATTREAALRSVKTTRAKNKPGAGHGEPGLAGIGAGRQADGSRGGTGSNRTLLIIEDDPGFANTLSELARSLHYDCWIAATADEGIELALRHKPTAIVLDIRLPDHTGLAVLDRLKHDPSTRHIPVQVISGVDHSQAALEMGAASVMLKPVDRDQLTQALSQLERKASPGERTILIVEDNTVQRDSIRQLLSADGVRTVAVASAAAALEQLRGTTFDCMVLDLALPDASGYELLEKMAADETCAFPPVIVYTARSLSAEEEQQLRRYSKSIIIKGARSPERLLDETTLFLHRVEASLPVEQQRLLRVARSRESVFEGRRVLLVEDDVRNIFAITRVLEPHGVKLEIARNGKEAVAALEVKDTGAPIELVLMDIMMPEMDGLEAMQALRRRPELAQLPIIALTAKAMPDDRQHALEAGANDYITKPLDIDKLLSLLRIWLPPRKDSGAWTRG